MQLVEKAAAAVAVKGEEDEYDASLKFDVLDARQANTLTQGRAKDEDAHSRTGQGRERSL